jgi:fatty acid desaturase
MATHTLSMSASALCAGAVRADAASSSSSSSSRRRVRASARAVSKTTTRVRASIAYPAPSGDAEPPKEKVVIKNTNPLSAESAKPVNIKPKGEPVRIKIDDQWYDCAGWAKAHPGGERWIHFFDGRDGTDAFYALHSYGPNGSSKAADRLAKLPRCDPPPEKELKTPTPSEYAASMSFREFRKKLEADGFFKRDWLKETWALVQVLGLYAAGQFFAYSNPVMSTVLLGLGMVQAGWLGHDYVHGRGPLCEALRYMPTLLNGHGVEWWSQKHSMHHTFTNEEHMDNDVMMEPFFFLRPPSESGRPDSPLRKYQHIFGYPLLSIMFWLWRFHSAESAWRRKDKKELVLLGANYAWLAFCMPWQVAIGSVFLSGFIVASLVSATHQSEEIMEYGEGAEYVEGQFRSTRDAETVFGPLETWIWGGMDTQLEHHLFPTMPRYRYHALRPILKAWAKANDINYRISPSTKIIADNLKLLKEVAAAP